MSDKVSIEPFVRINKELELQFVLGCSVDEFASTLEKISSASPPASTR